MVPSTPQPEISADALKWIRRVFADANKKVAQRICRMPTGHETALDMALVSELSAVPVTTFVSGATVRIETHYLGADFGIGGAGRSQTSVFS
jgi:hypothetical protein